MGITCRQSKSVIDDFFRKAMEIMRNELFQELAKLGEKCVIRAKDRPEQESWKDHSGNLRSSIGYAIYDHGKNLIEGAFAPIKGGKKGQEEGQKMVDELASKYATTYALVVVAGMNYAEYVEACESKDVLASTEIWAKGEIGSHLKRAEEKAIAKINNIRI